MSETSSESPKGTPQEIDLTKETFTQDEVRQILSLAGRTVRHHFRNLLPPIEMLEIAREDLTPQEPNKLQVEALNALDHAYQAGRDLATFTDDFDRTLAGNKLIVDDHLSKHDPILKLEKPQTSEDAMFSEE